MAACLLRDGGLLTEALLKRHPPHIFLTCMATMKKLIYSFSRLQLSGEWKGGKTKKLRRLQRTHLIFVPTWSNFFPTLTLCVWSLDKHRIRPHRVFCNSQYLVTAVTPFSEVAFVAHSTSFTCTSVPLYENFPAFCLLQPEFRIRRVRFQWPVLTLC